MGAGGRDPRLPDGWHVIQYRQLVAGNTKTFEQVRPELEAEYLESERERAFNDLTGKLVDRVYDDPSSLAPAAQEFRQLSDVLAGIHGHRIDHAERRPPK